MWGFLQDKHLQQPRDQTSGHTLNAPVSQPGQLTVASGWPAQELSTSQVQFSRHCRETFWLSRNRKRFLKVLFVSLQAPGWHSGSCSGLQSKNLGAKCQNSEGELESWPLSLCHQKHGARQTTHPAPDLHVRLQSHRALNTEKAMSSGGPTRMSCSPPADSALCCKPDSQPSAVAPGNSGAEPC